MATNFSRVFQPIFMVLFSWSFVAICGLMLLIQIEIVEFYGFCVLIFFIWIWIRIKSISNEFFSCTMKMIQWCYWWRFLWLAMHLVHCLLLANLDSGWSNPLVKSVLLCTKLIGIYILLKSSAFCQPYWPFYSNQFHCSALAALHVLEMYFGRWIRFCSNPCKLCHTFVISIVLWIVCFRLSTVHSHISWRFVNLAIESSLLSVKLFYDVC